MIRMNAPPWRLGAATAILGLAAACAAQPRGDTIGPNEFRRAGDTLLCFTLEQPGKAAGTNPSEQDCLRIGSVRIGQPAAEIRRHFGKPYDTLEHLGATVLVYPIGPDADPMPYWAISVRDGSVIAIQITGRAVEPIPVARQPRAPAVVVWESAPITIMPGPIQGPSARS